MGFHVTTVLCFCLCCVALGQFPQGSVKIDLKHVTFTTDTTKFLSLGMDANLIRNRWQTFDFASERLMTLAKGMAPAYLRLSGTDADRMHFSENGNNNVYFHSHAGNIEDFPSTNFTMTGSDWININKFCSEAGWTLIFGLNGQLRPGGSDWDYTNAVDLLKFSLKNGYTNMHFEIGNEPDIWYEHKNMVMTSPENHAMDFRIFRQILDQWLNGSFKNSLLFGPDIANDNGGKYLKPFLQSVGTDNILYAVTWHHYYGSGAQLSTIANFSNPEILDSYAPKMKATVDDVSSIPKQNWKIGNGETGSTYNDPFTGIGEEYAALYMLLDKLGLSAQGGMDFVAKQTFFGFWLALVDAQLNPTPLYWVALLHKQTVGPKVLDLNVTVNGVNSNKFRVYAHCTADHAPGFRKGSVTVFAINLFDMTPVSISFPGITGDMDQYVITPNTDGDPKKDYLNSKFIQINMHKMEMTSNSSLPTVAPWSGKAEEGSLIPEHRMAFFILKDAMAPACT